MMADDPANPKLLMIQASLSKNPELTVSWAFRTHGVSYECLAAWEEKGWVKFGATKKKKHPWRRGLVTA